MNNDRIEKQIFLKAPRARVWSAIAESGQFGAWFGVKFDGDFKPGARMEGRMTIKNFEGRRMEIVIDRVEPQTLFSYRWHPYAIDEHMDYSKEPMTLVEFHLDERDGGTRLTVIESGFDSVPAARRAEALRMNTHGWAAQLQNIERHVAGS